MVSITLIFLVGKGVTDLLVAFSHKILLKQLVQLNANKRLFQHKSIRMIAWDGLNINLRNLI